ncbi:hypothetical protein WICPIJ_002361 [Wickerhamomyces pijperi]|uniref:Uncharacterized protein n=1 Tax=Wickerhamomyces pijperi TaxID=599730 RepID=A0A9P8Q9T7_WICPI|nr:hypothetical protein WICPIJ_002361 [Wickerhamomyces pijperi]
MAKCSLLSMLLEYKWRKISVPCVVGIRALARHFTIGKVAGSNSRVVDGSLEVLTGIGDGAVCDNVDGVSVGDTSDMLGNVVLAAVAFVGCGCSKC